MVPHNPLLIGLAGYMLSESQYTDREEYVESLERRIEDQSRAYSAEYQALSSRYSRLQEYAKTLEAERDHLRSLIQDISRHYPAIEKGLTGFIREFQRVRADTERQAQETDAKLRAYEAVKALLTRLVDQGETLFSPKIPKKQLKWLRTFVQQLP